jgi:hypothetical protein
MPKPKSGEEAKVPLQAVVLADSFTQVRAPSLFFAKEPYGLDACPPVDPTERDRDRAGA